MKINLMMKKEALLFFLLLSLSTMAQGVEAYITQQMREYPESHLLDIYKSCFQDYMGAERLVADGERARVCLIGELANVRLDYMLHQYYEPCGVKGQYVRVSLRAVMENKITTDALLGPFVRSANTRKRPLVGKWAIAGIISLAQSRE